MQFGDCESVTNIRPQLLVSVRSSQEAAAALQGGADIIDVKEPRRGSLGRSDSATIADVLRFVRAVSPETLVSAALGEVSDGADSSLLNTADGQCPDLLKCGLSQLVDRRESWPVVWNRFRSSVTMSPGTSWVAASYADHERASAPDVVEVLEQGHQSGCPVLLLDTFEKDETSLFDWVSITDLIRLRKRTHDYGMKLAVAGRITSAMLPQVLTIGPDIVAVRGAACEQGNRTSIVTANRVRDLSAELRSPSLVSP